MDNKSREESRKANGNRERKGMTVSAGFIVRSKDGRYLLGRTTKFPKKRCWTVFKGQQEEGESLIYTATRELREESGIDILRKSELQKCQSTVPFHTFLIKEKIVYLYLLIDEEGVLDDFNFSCNSYWGKDRVPEICDHRWFDIDEMESFIFPSQRGLIDKLRDLEKDLSVE